MESGNLFESIPEDLKHELFDVLVQNPGVKIERIVSKGHVSPASGWYDQERNEWVLVLKGCAAISFDDGMEISLKSGDFLNIPAHRKHKVSWTDPETETIWLAVHY